MTEALYRDAYLQVAEAKVTRITEEGGVVLDRSLFYPQGGGQPGDAGALLWDDREIGVVNTVKGAGDEVVCQIEPGAPLPDTGQTVTQQLDWDRRFAHMRVHTGLHLLSVVIPLPVSGGAITAVKGRLDFDMPEAPEDKQALQDALNELIARDLPVSEDWITEAELDANPGLVKTMSVQPPRGAGRIRLIRIGAGDAQVDLQPCGGTHVRRTSEIGPVTLGKIEKKGARNRRVNMLLG
jgi:misacylated tRNA(Ala) deacylase